MKAKLFYPSPKVVRPTNATPARVLLPMLLITLALLLVGSTADAHGIGYYQIRGAQMSPYVIHTWVAPGVLRTGDVHIDTAVMDINGDPALGTLVRVAFIPLEGDAPPLVSLAGAPDPEYPHARGASFHLKNPGMYMLEIGVSDNNGMSGVTTAEVEVTTVAWQVKAFIAAVGLFSASTGVWLLFLTRAFWMGSAMNRAIHHAKLKHLYIRRASIKSLVTGGTFLMSSTELQPQQSRTATLMQRLNGPLHAPALWIFMLVIVAHWLEHVLQIYQIYGLGWAPSSAGGILGVIYPQLIESEVLHFVYDFIQWAGVLVLSSGFKHRARTFWTIALVLQTWHYIEHVLLMGQYLTGYYLFGAPHQISILQYWFPRAELHFVYNLLVFIPMVIAVHYYVQPKLAMLAALNAARLAEQAQSNDPA